MNAGFGFAPIKPGSAFIIITDATLISTITNPASWNEDGDYTGSTTGLVAGNYYIDSNFNQFYIYLKTAAATYKLIRWSFNTYVAG